MGRKTNTKPSDAAEAEASGEFKELRDLIVALGNNIKSNYETLNKLINDVKNELDSSINKKMEEINECMEKHAETVRILQNDNEELKKQNVMLKSNLENLKHTLDVQADKILQLDTYSHRENLIFHRRLCCQGQGCYQQNGCKC